MTNENEQLKRLLTIFIKEYCELFWTQIGTGITFDDDYINDPISHVPLTLKDKKIIFSILKDIINLNSMRRFSRCKWWDKFLSQMQLELKRELIIAKYLSRWN